MGPRKPSRVRSFPFAAYLGIVVNASPHGLTGAALGLLGAALYNPLWASSVRTSGDFAIARIGLLSGSHAGRK